MTHFSQCAVNVRRKVFKTVSSSLSVSAVSVSPVDVVKIITTPIYQYKNPASKHAIVRKAVFNISYVNTSPFQTYYVMFVKCLHPYLFLQISPPHSQSPTTNDCTKEVGFT